MTSCEALTTNVTVWPIEILRFDGVNAKPLCVTVLLGAVVVVVVCATIEVVDCRTVVVVTGTAVVFVLGLDVVVVVASTMRVINFVDDFAGNLFDLAICNFNTHEPVAPIVSLCGLLVGDNAQEPFFDHVFSPGEFVETTADKFLTSPAIKDEIFHVRVVVGEASTEPPTQTPANTPMRRRADFEKIFTSGR